MENYIILEMIGEGAFGKVYKGQRKCTNQIVAIKKIIKKGKKEKELNKKKGEKNNGDLICEVDLAYDESDMKFSQRIDNLQKRNNELIKMKFKKKEILIEDDDKNFKNSLLFEAKRS